MYLPLETQQRSLKFIESLVGVLGALQMASTLRDSLVLAATGTPDPELAYSSTFERRLSWLWI
jgi:hypothetical protein